MKNEKIVILGSGMAGLGASNALQTAGISAVLYDKNSYPGGHTATFVHDSGFVFDDGPHISFTKNERLQKLFADNAGNDFQTLTAYVNNYYRGAWIKHPAQANMFNLPDELKVRCLLDFIDENKTDVVENPANYLEWLVSVFGEGFAVNFPAVYGKKYHTVGPEAMSTVWMGPRLYRPSLEEVLRGAIFAETPDVHYVSHFRYPTTGGFMSFLQPFVDAADLRLDHEVLEIDPASKTLTFVNNNQDSFDHLISSIPLPTLVPMIKGAPENVREAASKLACTTCVVVNIGVARDDFTKATWSYFYDEDLVFTRISFPHMMSTDTCPSGCGSLQVECYFSDKYRPLDLKPDDLIQPVIDDLKRIGLLNSDEKILHSDASIIRYANIIFDLDREAALPVVHDYLDSIGIVYVGRFGEWGYQWTDEAFLSGEGGARKIIERTGGTTSDPDL